MSLPRSGAARIASDFMARLDAIDARLAAHSANAVGDGLTGADPDTGERWQAAQVWAHMAEFVGYWQHQVGTVIERYDGTPVPFGRVKTDAARIAAIEAGRREQLSQLARRVSQALSELRRYLSGLDPGTWDAVGRHRTKGEMDVAAIVDEFLVGHLEEHLDQLDEIADGATR